MNIKKSKDFNRWKIEHNKILLYIILFLIAVLICIVFQIKHLNKEKNDNNALNDTGENVGMANPASVYCINQSGKLEIRSDEQGNQYGVCIFDDGSECEEWKFFRGECGQMCGGIAGIMCPDGETCNMQGKKYPDASGICVEKLVGK